MWSFDILVPQYNETEEVITPLLLSIAKQSNKALLADINVLICNNMSNVKLSESFLKRFPYKIKYMENNTPGVSAARNFLLDQSKAEYVMYCDADDMFGRSDALDIIYKAITEKHPDFFMSNFYEEFLDFKNKKAYLMPRDTAIVFVHGKAYRREFLVENDIRWNEKLCIHEDSFFNYQAFGISKNTYIEKTYFYVWKWRADSVARRDPNFKVTSYHQLIESQTYLIEELRKKAPAEYTNSCLLNTLATGWYITNSFDWYAFKDNKIKNLAKQRIKKAIIDNYDLWKDINPSFKERICNEVANLLRLNYKFNDKCKPFIKWVESIYRFK